MKISFGKKSLGLPANRPLRIGLGVLLMVGGVLGFLPVLGFWMIPLGLVILSVDFPSIRRWRRRTTVALLRWWNTSPRAAGWRRLWLKLTRRWSRRAEQS